MPPTIVKFSCCSKCQLVKYTFYIEPVNEPVDKPVDEPVDEPRGRKRKPVEEGTS